LYKLLSLDLFGGTAESSRKPK